MTRALWPVTFEIVTQESAEHGDSDSRGYISQDETLRYAIDSLFGTRTSACDGITAIEPNDSRHEFARWITVYNGMEFETGAHESRSLHFPDHITCSSRARLIRYLLEGNT